jgi:CheY-like chemotaxis protein
MPESKPILIVEDDRVDVLVLKRVLKDLHVMNELACTVNGEDALAHLRTRDSKMPCLILLDLNMPKMNGFEFLTALRGDDTIKDIPVVVVTTSAEPQDTARSFELGAVAYVVKCCDYREFREKLKVISPYTASAPSPAKLEMVPR